VYQRDPEEKVDEDANNEQTQQDPEKENQEFKERKYSQ